MIIGIPKEIKPNEGRVAITPNNVKSLCQSGHQLLIQKGAGIASNFSNESYKESGAKIVDKSILWEKSNLILKVKEPQKSEIKFLNKNQKIFCYLHLASSKELTQGLMKSGCTAYAYETLEYKTLDGYNETPLLAPMSKIAGRLAVERGATFLNKLLYNPCNLERAVVGIVGAGQAGMTALLAALDIGADVKVYEKNKNHFNFLCRNADSRDDCKYSVYNKFDKSHLKDIDLLIGAIHSPGDRPEYILSRKDLKLMKPKSVIVDISIDQGGCFETSKPTTHSNPVYTVDKIIHYCVANMPGCVPYSSTQALSSATFPFIKNMLEDIELFESTYKECCNVKDGKIINKRVKSLYPDL